MGGWKCGRRIEPFDYRASATRITSPSRSATPWRKSERRSRERHRLTPLARRRPFCSGSSSGQSSNRIGKQPADAALLHRHAPQPVGRGHRPLLVRDDDELAPVEELAQHAREAGRVRLVERRVHLVEDAERARLAPEDREQERDRGERLLAAGEERERAQFLARRAGGDLDAGLQHVEPVFQNDVRLPAAEQLAEQFLEVAADRRRACR